MQDGSRKGVHWESNIPITSNLYKLHTILLHHLGERWI